MLRTGSKEFGEKFLWDYKKRNDLPVGSKNGYLLDKDGNPVVTLEEIDCFKLCNMEYVKPENR